MTRRRAGMSIAAVLLVLLPLVLPEPEPRPADPAVERPIEPVQLDLCAEAPRTHTPAPAEADALDADDTGGPLVVLPTRGFLRVQARREDGAPEPDATVEIVNCDRARPLGEREWSVQPGPCTVVAWRTDGRFATPRQLARVEIATDEETLVGFSFPIERTGGIGVVLDGSEIVEVVPESPADAAGLVAGDLLATVDGVEVVDLDPHEITELLTGPEETPVLVELVGDTGLVALELTRAFLDPG